MSTHTFWAILLKIIGIYVLVETLSYLPHFVFELINSFSVSQAMATSAWLAMPYLLLTLGVKLFIVSIFIFRTDKLINALSLKSSIHEEHIDLNIHRSNVLSMVIIVAGLIVFVDSLPDLLQGLYGYFQVADSYKSFEKYPYAGVIVSALAKVLISFFMISSSRLIINFIERKRRGKSSHSHAE